MPSNALTDKNISATYKSLLKTNVGVDTDGVSASLTSVDSGAGTASSLSIGTNQVRIKSATNSTTAFEVMDTADNSYIKVDNSSTPKQVIINDDTQNCDFIVKGDVSSNLLNTDADYAAGYGRVGIGCTGGGAKLTIESHTDQTVNQLRLQHDATSHVTFAVDTDSHLTITCAESGTIKLDDSTILSGGKDLTLTSGNLIMGSLTNGLQINGTNTIAQTGAIDSAVELNATAGVIICLAQTMAAGAEAEFTFTNSTIETDSVILLTVQCDQNVANGTYVAEILSISTGSCVIRLSNPNAVATQSGKSPKIHFLVIKTG